MNIRGVFSGLFERGQTPKRSQDQRSLSRDHNSSRYDLRGNSSIGRLSDTPSLPALTRRTNTYQNPRVLFRDNNKRNDTNNESIIDDNIEYNNDNNETNNKEDNNQTNEKNPHLDLQNEREQLEERVTALEDLRLKLITKLQRISEVQRVVNERLSQNYNEFTDEERERQVTEMYERLDQMTNEYHRAVEELNTGTSSGINVGNNHNIGVTNNSRDVPISDVLPHRYDTEVNDGIYANTRDQWQPNNQLKHNMDREVRQTLPKNVYREDPLYTVQHNYERWGGQQWPTSC